MTTALSPVLSEVAGLPGAPTRITQVAGSYSSGEFEVGQAWTISGRPPVLRLPLGALNFPIAAKSSQNGAVATRFAEQLMLLFIHAFVGAADGVGTPAQQAVQAALMRSAGMPFAKQTKLLSSTGLPPWARATGHGEPERASGRWLPWLRLGVAVLLTTVALGLLAAGSSGGLLPGGVLALLRNLAGMVGTGLIFAAAVGGAFGWVGSMAYLLITESALAAGWATPWIWPARPPHDRGAAICASLVFAAGAAVITLHGGRERAAG